MTTKTVLDETPGGLGTVRATDSLNRVRSAVTQWVNSIEAEKVNTHKDLQMETSGQLRNLG